MKYFGYLPTLFIWWYSRGVKDFLTFMKYFYKNNVGFFSIPLIFTTFFSPWKRLVKSRQPGIDGLKDWLLDNLISRGVGVSMRLFLLLGYILFNAFFASFFIVSALFWIFMPIIIPFMFINIFIAII